MASGSGVVIFKLSDQSEENSARGVAFLKLEQFPQVTNLTTPQGESLRLLNQRILKIVPSPDLTRSTITDELGMASLRNKLEEITALQQQFPRTKEELEPLRAEYDRALQMIDSGNVLVAGRWMSREAYQREMAAGQAKTVDLVVDGKPFSAAKVRGLNGTSVVIAHSGGVASVPAEKLTDEQIRLLNSTSATVVIDRASLVSAPATTPVPAKAPKVAADSGSAPKTPPDLPGQMNPVSIGMVTPTQPTPGTVSTTPAMSPPGFGFVAGGISTEPTGEPQRVPIDPAKEPVAAMINELKLWHATEKEAFEMRPMGSYRLDLAHHKAMQVLGELKGEAHGRMLAAIRQQALIKMEVESNERAERTMTVIPTNPQYSPSDEPIRGQSITSATASDEPTGALSPEYVAFMRIVSDPWTTEKEDAVKLVECMPPNSWTGLVLDLDLGAHPLMTQHVGRLRETVSSELEVESRIQGRREDLRESIWDTAVQAAGGEFETFNARGQQVGNEGFSQVAGSLADAALFLFATSMRGKTEDRLADARLVAVDELLRRQKEIYPGSPQMLNLVTPEISRESLALVNTSGRDLTNVTIQVIGTHFVSAPEDFGLRQVFVPRLAKDQKLHLKPQMRRTFFRDGWAERSARPPAALFTHSEEEEWAFGLGGILSAKVTTFALEGHEVDRVFTFPDAAKRAAQCELDDALRTLGTPGIQPEDQAWAVTAARRAVGLVPPGDPLAAEAASLIANPAAAAEKGRVMVTEAILERITGTYKGTYEMTWAIRPVQGHTIPPGQVDAQIQDIGNKVSEGQQDIDSAVQLEITGFTPEGYLGGVLSSPYDPKLRRQVIAKAPVKEELNFTLEFIPAPGGPESRSLTDSHLTQCLKRLYLVFADGRLNNPSAIAAAGQFEVECKMALWKEAPEE
jgi:hypothetical protein